MCILFNPGSKFPVAGGFRRIERTASRFRGTMCVMLEMVQEQERGSVQVVQGFRLYAVRAWKFKNERISCVLGMGMFS